MSAYAKLSNLIRTTHPHLVPYDAELLDTAIPKIVEVIEDLQRQVSELSNAKAAEAPMSAWIGEARQAYEKWAEDVAQDAVMWVSALDVANKTVTVSTTSPPPSPTITHDYQRLVYADGFECIHCHHRVSARSLYMMGQTLEELSRIACAGSQTATTTPTAALIRPLSVHIPHAGVWEYFVDNQGYLTLKCYSHSISTPQPPASKYWLSVNDSGTIAGPDIDNLVFTADQSSFAVASAQSSINSTNCSSCGAAPYTLHANACTGHVYQSPWYLGAAGGSKGQTITWTPGIAAPAVAEEAPSEVSLSDRHRCRCPRENFALNGAGCSCNGI